jgi:[ribosomal protein S18]-alanine N-acetyltransferase
MLVRTAHAGDVPAILAIEQSMSTAAHWTAAQYEMRLENGCVLVAELKGRLCGFVCTGIAAGEWEVENVVTAASQLRRGVADQLMQALISRALDANASSVILEVRAGNVPARRLYEKHGFREVGRRANYYRDPSDDAILYTFAATLFSQPQREPR